jgi:hypothetical protein
MHRRWRVADAVVGTGDLGSSDTDHPVAGADAGSLAGR